LLQAWRLKHDSEPGDAVIDRIVRRFCPPRPPA
jgi:hypothetical protein